MEEPALDTGVKNRKPSPIAYQVRDGKDEQSLGPHRRSL